MKAPLYLTRFPLLKIDFTSTFSIKVFKTKKRDRSSMEGKDAEGEGAGSISANVVSPMPGRVVKVFVKPGQ